MSYEVFTHEYYMNEALKQAQIALEEDEIPIGAVIVCEKRIIARAYNQVEKLNDPTAHAEMLAFTSATSYLGGKYLNECSLYVTLEPCSMCAGASFWSQIKNIFYGASDTKRGFNLLSPNVLHPKTNVHGGLLAEESTQLLDRFFAKLRND